MTLQELRTLFPHTNSQIYINHAATSPLSLRVMDAVSAYLAERHEHNIENFGEYMPLFEETLHRFAAILGTKRERVEFIPNTSSGLLVLAQGLDWRPGDRIAIPACEFPANVYPFMNLSDRGVEVDFIPHRDATFTLDDVERTLKPETRLVSISWVQFLSGFRCDLRALVDLCHDRDILVAVDAIQGLGALSLDVEETGIDFLATGGHKWLMAAQGIGGMYVSERLIDRLRPSAGWLHGPVDWDDFFNYKLEFFPDARRFRTGTFNSVGIVSLHAALGLYQELGAEWCGQRVLENARHLRHRLKEMDIAIYGDVEDDDAGSGIVTFRIDRAEELHAFLKARRITCSLRNGLIRTAPTYYNSLEEMDEVADSIRTFISNRSTAA